METQQTEKPLTPEEVAQQTGGQILNNNAQPQGSDDEWIKAESNWAKFDKIGDFYAGTLVGRFEKAGQNNMPDQEVFELKQEGGDIVNVGVSIKKNYIISRMKNVKFGQKVKFAYEKDIPSKTPGFAPAKNIEVYLGGMDQAYVAEQAIDDTAVDNISFN